MRWSSLTFASLATLASARLRLFQRPSSQAHAIAATTSDASEPGFGKLEYFDQLIDHSNPSLGTFKQRYWWNTDHYGGPHSPISMDAPVEGAFAAEGNITSMTSAILPGLLAEDNNAAFIRMEHRYFGRSTPYNESNAETLQYLTLDNAIQDLIYFANNVVFPFDKTNGSSTKPDKAPWLLSGCSYAGTLSAWTEALAPGTFWAYEAGSAPIESFGSFWQYFVPIKNAMPKNCTADMQRIIKHVDQVLLHGSDANKTTLKSKFGLEDASDKNFANSLSEWMTIQQSHHVSDKINPLHISCDYLENQRPTVTAPFPGPDGVGLELAMDGLARLMGENPDPPFELDLWWWFLCNEPFESWQVWSPLDTTGLLSRLYNSTDEIQDVCEAYFPDFNGFKYGLKNGKTYHTHNKKTGGWRNVNSTRLVWVNGENDPWRPATVSSEYRPGGPLQSTDKVPVYVIKDGGHCNDYRTKDEPTEQGRPVYDAIRQHFRTWVAEFYEEHPGLK